MLKDIEMNTSDALLIIDIQNDFCPGGALAIDKADEIVPLVNLWIKKAKKNQWPVYASRDWHPKEHVSFTDEGGKWPPHCIQDSEGARFHKSLLLPDEAVIVTKGVRFDQDQNSAFDQTGLDVYLKRKGIRRLFVCGLALDVCVLATVMDALRSGFEVMLIAEATRPVDRNNGESALKKMIKAGAGITESGTDSNTAAELPVCTKAPEWAEHQRFSDSDEPCDDGRSGKI